MVMPPKRAVRFVRVDESAVGGGYMREQEAKESTVEGRVLSATSIP